MWAGELSCIHYTWECFVSNLLHFSWTTETKTKIYFFRQCFIKELLHYKKKSDSKIPLRSIIFFSVHLLDLLLTGGWNQLGLIEAKLFSLCVHYLFFLRSSSLVLAPGVSQKPHRNLCWVLFSAEDAERKWKLQQEPWGKCQGAKQGSDPGRCSFTELTKRSENSSQRAVFEMTCD